MLKEKFIGVDTEWKPSFSANKGEVSLFQISGLNDVFLVDLIALKDSKKLDIMLTDIFSNKDSTIVGFGFKNDLDQLAYTLPKMNFMLYIESFIDVQFYYREIMDQAKFSSL